MGVQDVRALRPRGVEDVAAMGVAVQANVAQLRIAQSKRIGADPDTHAIRTPSPGAVKRFRETLIDWKTIKRYSDRELALRLREVWGQLCLFCWLFGHTNPHDPPQFASCAARGMLRSAAEMHARSSRIERDLQRLLHEQQLRADPQVGRDERFATNAEASQETDLMVYGQSVRTASDEDLLRCSCEYAGMLAAIRWAADVTLTWGQDGIMDVGAEWKWKEPSGGS